MSDTATGFLSIIVLIKIPKGGDQVQSTEIHKILEKTLDPAPFFTQNPRINGSLGLI